MQIPLDTLKAITSYGVMAPSGDNCQPWIFKQEGNSLLLLNDKGKDTSLYNVKNTASLISHGAVLENIRIASLQFGFEFEEELFPMGEGEDVIARLTFHKTGKKPESLFHSIEKRCTNRLKYSSTPLTENTRETLFDSVAGFNGAELFLAESKAEKDIVAKALCVNDRLLFENRSMHDFLFEHIRWNQKEAEKTRDGMDIRTLGLDPIQRRAFKLLRSWAFVSTMNLFGFSRMVPMQSYLLSRGSAAIGLLQIDGVSARDFVRGGAALERLWLTAAGNGLSFQPMTGITFLLNRLNFASGIGLSDKHKELVSEAGKKLKKVFPLSDKKAMIMIFRIGFSKKPGVVSLRREFDLNQGHDT